MAKRTSTHRSPARFNARMLSGAKPAPFPGFIKPQLATLKSHVPAGKGWLHEIKFDGYRIQGHLTEGRPALFTRNGHDWTHRMPTLAEALARVPANHLIVDGEIIIPDSQGRSDHDALKEALGAGRQSHRFVFYLFDLMHLDGFDLRAAPLIERKRVLNELIANVGPPIVYSDHMQENGAKMFESASEMGLEGIVSKRASAPYRSGRTESWIKAKCVTRGTFTVVGFSPEGKGLVGALHLARKVGRSLVYCGRVGTGWTMKQSAELRQQLEGMKVDKPALPLPSRMPKVFWVRPLLTADVEYRTMTTAGLLRHAAWKGRD